MTLPDSQPAPVLTYEAGPTVAAAGPALRRIVVPPVPWRTALPPRYRVGLGVGGLVVLRLSVGTTAGSGEGWMIAPLVEASAVLGVLTLIVVERTHRRLAFEVTPEAFRVVVAGPFGVRRAAWPRSAVRDLSANAISGRLVLRVAGQDPLEYYVGPGVALEVTADVTAALSLVPAVPPATQILGPNLYGGTQASPARTVAAAAAGVATAAAIALLLIVPRLAGFGCPLLVAAAVAAGLVFGTQRKDFFT